MFILSLIKFSISIKNICYILTNYSCSSKTMSISIQNNHHVFEIVNELIKIEKPDFK